MSSLTTICLRYVFHCTYSWLKFTKLLWYVGCSFITKSEDLATVISSNIFSAYFFFSFCLKPLSLCKLELLILSHRLFISCSFFFQIFFSLCVHLAISWLSMFKFIKILLCTVHPLSSSSTEDFELLCFREIISLLHVILPLNIS